MKKRTQNIRHSVSAHTILITLTTVFICLCADMRVEAAKTKGKFIIAENSVSAPITVSKNDWPGVIRAARDLADDIGKVTGTMSEVVFAPQSVKGNIIVGTIGKNPFIDNIVSTGKLDVSKVAGQWESYVIENIDGNLVIAGSDKRGTIYGIYEISKRIGVSPWYFWADVPVHRQKNLYFSDRVVQESPKVKYRGIFINDEWPSFGGWCVNRFGGINSQAYARIFELLLRLKANYLWPAMWDTAFNEDDPACPALADEYGIVMGTSHHEPMMRSHKEYKLRRDSIGAWDYASNSQNIDRFFREGLERNKCFDNVITIGMRGDGDVAMGKGDDSENIKTLYKVIEGQRNIISDIYGRPDSVPQLWAVFTEVQRYYDAGFSVPEDATILLCDNNWGYLRRVPSVAEKARKGGFGLYYHIDMNGGPWNDRWVNTSPIPKLREQLNLAYRNGIDRLWIVNVGDLKPKELPIDFIMNYAWNPDLIGPGDEMDYLRSWSASVFGQEVADDVADILAKYPKYNLWRKAEVQVPGLFSVENYNEATRIYKLWDEIIDKAERVRKCIPKDADDAYFQLVYYPAVASTCVAQLYIDVTRNHYYAAKNDTIANVYAESARKLFVKDSLLTDYYNNTVSGGKWNGMMQDKHIGYSQWFMPERNIMPELRHVAVQNNCDASKECVSEEYSIEAINYSRNKAAGDLRWIMLPDLGRSTGCMGCNDVAATNITYDKGPMLEYDIDCKGDNVRIAIAILPTQDIRPERGLRIAVQVDNEPLQILDARRGLVDTFNEYTKENIERSGKLKPLPRNSTLTLSGRGGKMRNEIFDNMRWLDTTFKLSSKKRHKLKIIMVDPEIVVEKIVINPDNSCYSYFGPPCKE